MRDHVLMVGYRQGRLYEEKASCSASGFSCALAPEARTIRLKEPLVATLVCSNSTEEDVDIDFVTGRGLTLVVTRPGGEENLIPLEGHLSTLDRRPFLVPAQEEAGRRILLSLAYTFSSEGRHAVALRIRKPADNTSVIATAPATIDILPYNSAELGRVAQKLAERSLQAPGADAQWAAEALSLIDDPVARPYWIYIVENRSPGAVFGIDALAKLGKREAIEVLLRLFEGAMGFERLRIQEHLSRLRDRVQAPQLIECIDKVLDVEVLVGAETPPQR